MKLSAILGPLLDAKADHELIRKMVLAHEAEQADALERRRESDRRRQAAKTERDRQSRDSRERYDAVSSRARVEDKTSNLDIEPQKKENTHATDLAAFKSALSGVCDSERIDAFVKHRRTKRGAMTGYAAKLFLEDARKVGMTPSEAIDTCISRNWVTVKPEFLAGRNSRAGPTVVPMVKDNAATAARRRIDELQRQRTGTAVDDHQPASRVLSIDYERAGG